MLLAGASQGFQAGQAGHAHVRDHHADLLGLQDFERALTRRHRQSVKALAAQKRIQQAALPGVVIHDEDARSFGGGPVVFDCHRPQNRTLAPVAACIPMRLLIRLVAFGAAQQHFGWDS